MNNPDLSTITTCAASAAPPITLKDLRNTCAKLEAIRQHFGDKSAALEFQMAVEYGADAILPRKKWPFGGIGINMESPEGRRLADAIRKHLEAAPG